MGGDISVKSNYGEGSIFTFYANFKIENETAKTHYTIPAKIQHSHVLVVDDNQVAQHIFQQMLDCFGFRVSLALSAQEGIEQVKANAKSDPVTLILMDWKMPGMDGITATEIIKNQLTLDVIPAIILVTAHANENITKQNPIVWDDYLIKPVSQSILYDSIITVFSEQQAEKFSIKIGIKSKNTALTVVTFYADIATH